MNWIDIVILAILVISLFTGLSNGFVKELASLAALVLGIWGAIKFSAFTSAKLYEWFDMSGEFLGLISFIVTFLAIVVIINLIGVMVDKLVDAVSLGFLNKLLGAVFGVFKSVLILSVIFVILETIDKKKPFMPTEKREESVFYYPIADIAPSIFPIIGEGNFENSFDRLREPEPEPEEDSGVKV